MFQIIISLHVHPGKAAKINKQLNIWLKFNATIIIITPVKIKYPYIIKHLGDNKIGIFWLHLVVVSIRVTP